jgi:hypothetical protein
MTMYSFRPNDNLTHEFTFECRSPTETIGTARDRLYYGPHGIMGLDHWTIPVRHDSIAQARDALKAVRAGAGEFVKGVPVQPAHEEVKKRVKNPVHEKTLPAHGSEGEETERPGTTPGDHELSH